MRTQFALVTLLALVGCSGVVEPTESESVATTSDAIVRGTAETGRPYVMMVYSESPNGGLTRCTGTYIAPRVVLTAAHCLRPGRWASGTFVYWGKDYANDLSILQKRQYGPSIVPPQSQQNVWGYVEATEIYPNYSSGANYPDLAVLYLDRKPPMDPLPIYRNRLDDSWKGKKATLVGWGANKALSADITQVEGVGVKRIGTAPLEGTPTLADYHADDPNPGLLDASIRSHLIKTKGGAPNANTCAGDSGGPLIINQWGQDYVAGVSMWTGLWCEDYSIFTRLETFLPFLDEAYRKAGQAPVVSLLECVEPNSNGTYSAFFGYKNDNAIAIDVPYGDRNYFPADTASARPSRFESGDHGGSFVENFAATQQLYWKLSPTNSPTTELRVSKTSTRCPSTSISVRCLHACQKQIAATCDPPVSSNGTLQECYSGCMDVVPELVTPECPTQYANLLRCNEATPANDPSQWNCMEGYAPGSMSCDAEVTELFSCLGYM